MKYEIKRTNTMNKILTATLILGVATASLFGETVSAGEWATIFNGKDIDGWEKKGGGWRV